MERSVKSLESFKSFTFDNSKCILGGSTIGDKDDDGDIDRGKIKIPTKGK